MRKLASLTLSLFLLPGMVFADSPKDSPKDAPKEAAQPTKTAATSAATKTNAEIAAEMEELRQALQAQQEQLQMLKEELAKRDKEIEEAREAAASANSRAAEASTKATEAVATSTEVKTTTTQLNSTVATMAASSAAASSAALATSGQQKDDEKGPMAIRFKGVTITPVGFVAAESVSRQRAAEADINTPFTGIPYPGNASSKISENQFTGRQSRIGAVVEGKISDAKLTGYIEADFLGTGVTSNNRQSNSYVLRQRQFWGRIDMNNGWAFSGGQMWSLVTENKQGIVNRQEVLPQTIDPQYQVGFNWARQYGLRATKSFGDKFAVAASIEGSQSTIGGRGFSTYTNTSATGTVTTDTNFFFNGPGAGGGLFNFSDTAGYTLNKLPDFIFKAAWDPSTIAHFEVVGILSEFRSRTYPCAVVGTTAGNFPAPATPTVVACTVDGSLKPSALGATNQSSTGGGVEVRGRLSLFEKKLDASATGAYGTGTGRYASAQLADVTARPDGVLVPIKAASWLGKLEWHATPKLDLYAYFGGEYAGRVKYNDYTSVKVTNTPAIPPCGTNPTTGVIYAPCTAPTGVTPPTFQPGYPALTATSISTTGIGGYGNPLFNNSGCSTETPPTPTGPSSSGFPTTGGSCAGDVRYIAEGTFGFWHRIYQGEKGRLQWGLQYSYLYKVGWSGNNNGGASIQPKAVDNMVFTSFRYYLP